MINPIKQGYVANTALNSTKVDKEAKTNETQKSENDKASRIAEQVKNGTYQLDMKATADAIAYSLL